MSRFSGVLHGRLKKNVSADEGLNTSKVSLCSLLHGSGEPCLCSLLHGSGELNSCTRCRQSACAQTVGGMRNAWVFRRCMRVRRRANRANAREQKSAAVEAVTSALSKGGGLMRGLA